MLLLAYLGITLQRLTDIYKRLFLQILMNVLYIIIFHVFCHFLFIVLQGANPIYKDPKSTFQNPTYKGGK